MRANRRQTVTNKIVNRKISIPLFERKKVRAALFEFKNIDPKSKNYRNRYRSLIGRINNIKNFHPRLAGNMNEELHSLFSSPKSIEFNKG